MNSCWNCWSTEGLEHRLAQFLKYAGKLMKTKMRQFLKRSFYISETKKNEEIRDKQTEFREKNRKIHIVTLSVQENDLYNSK